MTTSNSRKAYFHLPGAFEFYPLYHLFLPLFREHREYFYDWCEIGSLYGSPSDCLWGGGRVELSDCSPKQVLALTEKYEVSLRLTFSNSLLKQEHLADKKCNELCQLLTKGKNIKNGVIVHSDLLVDHLKSHYPDLYLVSSTTKVQANFDQLKAELQRDDFALVVPDFRLNKAFEKLTQLPQEQKDKVEFLCNECCWVGCQERKACYEAVSRKNLGEDADHVCHAPHAKDGYRFSQAMQSPAFIGVDDIKNVYLPMGFNQFKIEGRGLGSALILEFLLHYLTKPQYQLHVREAIYLDNTLDLF